MASQGELLPFAREIVDVPVDSELGESFLAYSLSVFTARAIPDVRDGLKPVQRRILYSMREMGLRPDRPHRKCAHVVGDVMAKYHPHGDSAIYDTLVRLARRGDQGKTEREEKCSGQGHTVIMVLVHRHAKEFAFVANT